MTNIKSSARAATLFITIFLLYSNLSFANEGRTVRKAAYGDSSSESCSKARFEVRDYARMVCKNRDKSVREIVIKQPGIAKKRSGGWYCSVELTYICE